MQNTPASERTFISFFGAVNAGKSSVVNRVTGQTLSIVSDTPGTTTDPVIKSMELLPIGPVAICDTAGLDDNTALGEARAEKTYEILRKTDIAVLVVDSTAGLSASDAALIETFREKKLPYLVCYNKSDLAPVTPKGDNELAVCALTGEGIETLKNRLAAFAVKNERTIVADLFAAGDIVLLVTPIDEAAPKGRLILPEQMMIHEILDHASMALCCQPPQLRQTLAFLAQSGKKIRMVITDSQAFSEVSKAVPEEIPLASFSILMARYKGVLEEAARGVKAVDMLQDGDKVLMSEGCTHHRQCQDIGTVKIPAWLRAYTKKSISIETSSGFGFPEDLSPYRMVIHCGGCMLNEREVQSRMRQAREQGVPFTNYGITIAYMNGILQRSAKAIGLAL